MSIPADTRRLVMQRCGGECECCGDVKDITLHHLHYRSVGAEEPDDLLALCWECHRREHRDLIGQYWPDTEEMETYWYTYWNELDKE